MQDTKECTANLLKLVTREWRGRRPVRGRAAAAAVGRAGEPAERDKLGIVVGGVTIAEAGAPHPDYREAQITDHMKGQDIDIEIDVGVGRGRATVWTCDLTHGYISINGDYRS